MEIIRLKPDAELSEVSYLQAMNLLHPEPAGMLVCSVESCPRSLSEWLWENHRVTAITLVPKEILRHGNAWALYGFWRAVIMEGF